MLIALVMFFLFLFPGKVMAENRKLNIVIIGNGYKTEQDVKDYFDPISEVVEKTILAIEPFKGRQSEINIERKSGINDFNCANRLEYCFICDETKINNYLIQNNIAYDYAIVLHHYSSRNIYEMTGSGIYAGNRIITVPDFFEYEFPDSGMNVINFAVVHELGHAIGGLVNESIDRNIGMSDGAETRNCCLAKEAVNTCADWENLVGKSEYYPFCVSKGYNRSSAFSIMNGFPYPLKISRNIFNAVSLNAINKAIDGLIGSEQIPAKSVTVKFGVNPPWVEGMIGIKVAIDNIDDVHHINLYVDDVLDRVFYLVYDEPGVLFDSRYYDSGKHVLKISAMDYRNREIGSAKADITVEDYVYLEQPMKKNIDDLFNLKSVKLDKNMNLTELSSVSDGKNVYILSSQENFLGNFDYLLYTKPISGDIGTGKKLMENRKDEEIQNIKTFILDGKFAMWFMENGIMKLISGDQVINLGTTNRKDINSELVLDKDKNPTWVDCGNVAEGGCQTMYINKCRNNSCSQGIETKEVSLGNSMYTNVTPGTKKLILNIDSLNNPVIFIQDDLKIMEVVCKDKMCAAFDKEYFMTGNQVDVKLLDGERPILLVKKIINSFGAKSLNLIRCFSKMCDEFSIDNQEIDYPINYRGNMDGVIDIDGKGNPLVVYESYDGLWMKDNYKLEALRIGLKDDLYSGVIGLKITRDEKNNPIVVTSDPNRLFINVYQCKNDGCMGASNVEENSSRKCEVDKPGYVGLNRVKGDYNCDGIVNLVDFNIWRNEGIDGEKVFDYWRADGDGDGVTTVADYSTWRKEYLKQ